jgi:RNA-directed DNA polymerase
LVYSPIPHHPNTPVGVIPPKLHRGTYLGEKFRLCRVADIRRYRLKRGIHKTLIKPSKESISKVKTKLREQWRSLKNKDVKIIMRRLNPIIKGWANYYRSVVSSKTFVALDTWMFQRETRYANHKHPKKSKKWKRKKYWGKLNPKRADNWVFGDTAPLKWNLLYDKDEISCPHVTKFKWVEIKRHVLVKDTASPDDPQLRTYWERRMKAGSAQLTESSQKIANRQRGKCPMCNESLFNGEEIQKHHILPKNEGGTETYKNLQLVHYFCHQRHSKDQKGGNANDP